MDIKSLEVLAEEPIKSDVFQNGKVNFCLVSRLSEEKGAMRLLSVAAALKASYDFRLVVVGDGPQRSICEHFVEQNGLQNNVGFLGNQKNP